jgi:hypothetical protein
MKQSKRFTLSYPELSQRGDRVQTVVARDVHEFVKYGYSETISDTVREKTEQFKSILPDMYWEGQKTLSTNSKDQCRGKLVEILGEIAFKAKLALGADSKEYATFRFSGMDRQSDQQLVLYSKHVCKTAEFFTEQLSTRNVTESILAQAEVATTALDNAIDKQTEAIALREQKSVERLSLGNELYELILELCEVGKRIWENKNEAFYHDYVLYGSNKSSSKTENEEEVSQVVEE